MYKVISQFSTSGHFSTSTTTATSLPLSLATHHRYFTASQTTRRTPRTWCISATSKPHLSHRTLLEKSSLAMSYEPQHGEQSKAIRPTSSESIVWRLLSANRVTRIRTVLVGEGRGWKRKSGVRSSTPTLSNTRLWLVIFVCRSFCFVPTCPCAANDHVNSVSLSPELRCFRSA